MGRKAWWTALLLVGIAGAPPAHADDPADAERTQLARAKQALESGKEPTVRQGAELCLKVGTANAMELLVAVLDAENPHFRDIVWEVIPKFTDPYARQVIAARLKSSGKNTRTKEWCAQALGAYGVADFVGVLKGALTSGDDLLRAAAARALGSIADKSAFGALKERLRDDDPFARAAVIEALARTDPAGGKGFLWEGLRDADAGVRCALLAAVPSIYPDLAEETAANALADADWRPRAQAVENLCARRTKTAVDVLVRASGDGRPAVAQRAVTWLQSETGMKFTLRDQWESWWKQNREKFAFGE
jgi:HEAT repeat protein